MAGDKLTGNAFFFGNFAVTHDNGQYIVKERKVTTRSKNPEKIGKEKWHIVAYPSTLPRVFNYLAERMCMEHIGNLHAAVNKIDELRDMVKKITELKQK